MIGTGEEPFRLEVALDSRLIFSRAFLDLYPCCIGALLLMPNGGTSLGKLLALGCRALFTLTLSLSLASLRLSLFFRCRCCFFIFLKRASFSSSENSCSSSGNSSSYPLDASVPLLRFNSKVSIQWASGVTIKAFSPKRTFNSSNKFFFESGNLIL